MSALTSRQRWMFLLGGLFLVGEIALATQPGVLALVGGIANALLLLGGVGALVRAADRRVETSLDELVAVVVRIAKGDFEAEVQAPTAEVVGPMASAVEHARRRTAKQFDELLRDKQRLADELAQARERLRDPLVERRKEAVLQLALTVQVDSAGVEGEAEVLDFWLDRAEIAVDRALAKQLVPGQPLRIRLTTPDGTEASIDGVAAHATKVRHGDRLGWAVHWPAPLAPQDLWPPLWQAVNPRRDERTRPPSEPPLRAILHIGDASFSAEVLDLSTSGVGVQVAESVETLGLMAPGAVAALTLVLSDDRTVRDRVWVRSVDVREGGTKLGLALEGLDEGPADAIEAYLGGIRQDDAPGTPEIEFVC